jgi:hypothetical protein
VTEGRNFFSGMNEKKKQIKANSWRRCGMATNVDSKPLRAPYQSYDNDGVHHDQRRVWSPLTTPRRVLIFLLYDTSLPLVTTSRDSGLSPTTTRNQPNANAAFL